MLVFVVLAENLGEDRLGCEDSVVEEIVGGENDGVSVGVAAHELVGVLVGLEQLLTVLGSSVSKEQAHEASARLGESHVLEQIATLVLLDGLEELLELVGLGLKVEEVLKKSVVEHGETSHLLLDKVVGHVEKVLHRCCPLGGVLGQNLGELASDLGALRLPEQRIFGAVPLAKEVGLLLLGRNAAVDIVEDPRTLSVVDELANFAVKFGDDKVADLLVVLHQKLADQELGVPALGELGIGSLKLLRDLLALSRGGVLDGGLDGTDSIVLQDKILDAASDDGEQLLNERCALLLGHMRLATELLPQLLGTVHLIGQRLRVSAFEGDLFLLGVGLPGACAYVVLVNEQVEIWSSWTRYGLERRHTRLGLVGVVARLFGCGFGVLSGVEFDV